MKTLIAYASKYGFTKTCAVTLAHKLPGKVDLCDLDAAGPNLAEYDTVIVGGSVYAGQIRKPVKQFCAKNLEPLQKKRLGLFICGLAEGADAEKELETSFPKELLAAAAAKESFGGACDFGKMNFMEKAILKKITGSNESTSRIDEAHIARFAQRISASD
ncbi:MAG TPA: flavodoxin domain-containing protein [Candidatus Acidoferrum sp.]|nr:flavodoxin domain-containing protein [Candidatus Acidoferrum sp.]